MSKATVVPALFAGHESVIGYRAPESYLSFVPKFWEPIEERTWVPLPLIVVHVTCDDWYSHPLFRRIARLYRVRFYLAGPWNDYVLEADDMISHPGEIPWTEVLRESGRFFVRGYRIWGERTPLVSIINGGCCERICREIYATRPHFDLQGRGDGK
jgi:hypothetical protein